MRRRSVRGDVGEEVFKMFRGNRNAEREYTGVQVSKTSYSDKCFHCCLQHYSKLLNFSLCGLLGILYLLRSHGVILPPWP